MLVFSQSTGERESQTDKQRGVRRDWQAEREPGPQRDMDHGKLLFFLMCHVFSTLRIPWGYHLCYRLNFSLDRTSLQILICAAGNHVTEMVQRTVQMTAQRLHFRHQVADNTICSQHFRFHIRIAGCTCLSAFSSGIRLLFFLPNDSDFLHTSLKLENWWSLLVKFMIKTNGTTLNFNTEYNKSEHK